MSTCNQVPKAIYNVRASCLRSALLRDCREVIPLVTHSSRSRSNCCSLGPAIQKNKTPVAHQQRKFKELYALIVTSFCFRRFVWSDDGLAHTIANFKYFIEAAWSDIARKKILVGIYPARVWGFEFLQAFKRFWCDYWFTTKLRLETLLQVKCL